jgi:hypothetical protein
MFIKKIFAWLFSTQKDEITPKTSSANIRTVGYPFWEYKKNEE